MTNNKINPSVSGSSSHILTSFGNMSMNFCSVVCVNEFSSMQNLFNNFSSIDAKSLHEIKSNKEFHEFISSAVTIIHDAKAFSSIALEKVEDFDEDCFRLFYQLKTNTAGSSVYLDSATDFITYNKILDVLDGKSPDLREIMVVDERAF